jgi:hypothetical protein
MFSIFRLLTFALFYGGAMLIPGMLLVRVVSPEMPSSQRLSSGLMAGCLSVLGAAALFRMIFHVGYGKPLLFVAALAVAGPCLIVLRARGMREERTH